MPPNSPRSAEISNSKFKISNKFFLSIFYVLRVSPAHCLLSVVCCLLPFIDLAHLLCYDPFFFELGGIMSGQRDHFLAKSLESLQENIRRSGPAATASYTLVGAVLLLGGIGYLLDQWLMTSPWFLLGGLLLGMVVGFYEIAKAVWKR